MKVSRVLIRSKDGKILLARRAERSSLGGMWEAPGGKIDEGESAEQAARREVQEETGLILTAISPFTQMKEMHRGRELHTNFWTAQANETDTIIRNAHEHSEILWFDPKDVPDNLTPSARKALKDLTKT